jgi:hypothetical protein
MARSIALLVNPTNGIVEDLQRDALAAGSALGIAVNVVRASTAAERDQVLAGLSAVKPDGLAVAIDSLVIAERGRIVPMSGRTAGAGDLCVARARRR